jgi:chromosome segregation ATPase
MLRLKETKIHDLQEKLDNIQSKYNEKMTEIDKVQAKLLASDVLLDEKKKEIFRLQERQSEVIYGLENAKAEVKIQKNQRENIFSSIRLFESNSNVCRDSFEATFKSRAEALQTRFDNAFDQLRAYERITRTLRQEREERIRSMAQDHAKIEKQVVLLRKVEAEKSLALESAMTEMQNLRSTLDDAFKTRQVSYDQIKAKDEVCAMLQSELEKVKQVGDRACNDKMQLVKEKAELREELDRTRQEIKVLREEMTQTKNLQDAYQMRISDMELSVANKAKESLDLQEVIDSLQSEMNQLKATIRSRDGEIVQLQALQDKVQTELANAKDAHQDTLLEVQRKETRIKALESEKASLEEDWLKIRVAKQEAENAQVELRRQKNLLEDNLTKARSDLDLMKQEGISLKAEETILREQVCQLGQRLQQESSVRNRFENDSKTREDAMMALRSELLRYHKREKDLLCEQGALKNELLALAQELFGDESESAKSVVLLGRVEQVHSILNRALTLAQDDSRRLSAEASITEKLHHLVRALDTKVRVWQQTTDNLHQSNTNLEATQSKVEEAEAKILSKLEYIRKLEEEVEVWKGQTENLDQVQKKLEHTLADLVSSRAIANQLESQVAEQSAKIQLLESEVAQVIERKENMESLLNKRQTSMKAMHDENRRLKRSVELARQQSQEVLVECQQQIQAIGAIVHSSDEPLAVRVTKLKEELDLVSMEKNDLVEALERTRQELEEAESKLEEHEKQRFALQLEKETADLRLNEANNEIRQLISDRKGLQAERQDLQVEAARLNDNIRIKDGQCLLLETQLHDLQRQIQELQRENESALHSMKTVENRYGHDTESLRRDIAVLEQELHSQHQEYESMEGRLQNANEDLQRTLGLTQEEVTRLRVKVEKAEQRRRQLQAELDSAKDQQAFLSKSLEQHTTSIADLEVWTLGDCILLYFFSKKWSVTEDWKKTLLLPLNPFTS